MSNSTSSAETVALNVVTWLLTQDDLLPVFLGATGASEQDVKDGLSDPAFLGAVLDFLLMDDAWVMQFCDATQTPYLAPMEARQQLPGGAQTHWT